MKSKGLLLVQLIINHGAADPCELGFDYETFADSFLFYDQNEDAVVYHRAHKAWLENPQELHST